VNKLLIIIAESHLTFDIFVRHPANAGPKEFAKVLGVLDPTRVHQIESLQRPAFDYVPVNANQ
jgi:hypothetical protein